MRRNTLFFLGFLALVAAGFLLLRRDFDSGLFFESFRHIRPAWLIAAVGATFFGYGIRAVRWQVLLASLKPVRLGTLVSATLLGFSAIYALGRPGEVVRPLWIARREGIPVTGSFAAILLERILDLLLVLLLFAASLALVELPAGAGSLISTLTRSAWILWGAATLALAGAILFEKRLEAAAEKVHGGRIRKFLERFAKGLSAASNPRTLSLSAAYSFLLWSIIALQFWLMLVGLNLSLPLPAATLILVGSAVGSIAQVPGIGGGFQAGFVLGLTTFVGIPVETALAASLMAWITTFAPTLLAAAIYMMWKGISAHELITRQTA